MSRLRFLEGAVDSMHSENKDVLKEFVQTIKTQIERIVESLYNDILDYFEDDSAETTEMDSLRDKFTELTTKEVEEQLSKTKYELDDKRMLMATIGNSRLESRLFCVMHRLLKRHHKVFDIGKDKPLQAGVTIAMTNSWYVIFEAFEMRMRSLTESWRQQRMNIELQAQWYANGLFEDWYKYSQEQPESEEEYDEEWTDDDYDAQTEEDEDEFVEYATRASTAIETDDGSAVGEPHEGGEHEEDEDGDNEGEEEHDDVHQVADGSHDPEEYHQGTDREPSEAAEAHPAPNLSELEERMSRLEGKVDDLRDLMVQILGQLQNA